ncbi:hypothetical protein CPC08DRAFT_653352 [Agrocybe pediades]|nr:hypothetical protein CPC08DRAFT_653352 [Agrocybe pediades]
MNHLHPSLPPKPQSSAQPDQLEPIASTSSSQPSTSTRTNPIADQKQTLCAQCKSQPAKYTCPGCSTRTCSLPCSSSHKTATGCAGVRNKVAYVPMNQYTWGKMMDDYVFLEEMGRKVGEVGKEIVRGGYMAGGPGADARGGRGMMRGRGARGRGRGGHNAGGNGKTKRDILKMQLDIRDIDMELLPNGMERRKLNQSSWDSKNQTALLTIEFKFHKPKDPLAPSSELRGPPFTLLTHKNDLKTPLLQLLRLRLQEKEKATKKETLPFPEWVRHLVFPDPDDPESFVNPQCVMEAQVNPVAVRRANAKKAHHAFDPTQPLGSVLGQTRFVEYPSIEVWDQFPGTFINSLGLLRQEEERPRKKRKIDRKAGKLAIAGLLGGYGSEDDEDGEAKEDTEPKNMLAALGDYAESDEEEAMVDDMANAGDAGVRMGDVAEDEDMAVELSEDEDDGDAEVDPAVLLELMRAARGGEWTLEADDEDAVDWGDMDDAELE